MTVITTRCCEKCDKHRDISMFRVRERFRKRYQTRIIYRLKVCKFCDAEGARLRWRRKKQLCECLHCGSLYKPKKAA